MTARMPPPNRVSPVLLLFLIFPLIGLVVALGITLGSNQAPAAPTSVPPTPLAVSLPPMATLPQVVGAPVLDFELPALDGSGTVSLSDYAGRPVFLNFWATWCEPCKRELPAFEQFTAGQGDDGAVVLAINTGEDEATVRAFLEAQGIEGLNVLIDPSASAAKTYGVIQIPVTFVIDGAGNVRYPHYGEMTADDLAGYLAALAEHDE
ncbi:MAG: TlpA family protein disulfide reductase [Anaerolineae bacterium]|nr:TlpA family protein disulfide reductase [Anaerolineae bacterium]